MRNNRQVERKMKELIKKDRARTQVSRISQFGLLEMSRQRLRQSFIEWKTELSHTSIVQKLLYQIKEELNKSKKNSINLMVSSFVKTYIYNNFQIEINNIEHTRKVKINISEDHSLDNSQVKFEDLTSGNKKKSRTKKKSVKKDNVATKKKTVKKDKKFISEVKKISETSNSSLKEIKNKKTGWWQK